MGNFFLYDLTIDNKKIVEFFFFKWEFYNIKRYKWGEENASFTALYVLLVLSI